MSRVRKHDNSNAVTMFPFLAVLLCTMGALIVVLVCVTELSRARGVVDSTAPEVASEPSLASKQPAEDERLRDEIKSVVAYAAKLSDARARAKEQLEEDQLRLGHLEENMRRLQYQMASLQETAAEIDALQEEHYDDRDQATRELERLEELIADRQQSIKEIVAERKDRPRSYAILPYKGNHGTRRPPIYIECFADRVILQPEGVQLTRTDFDGPPGFGSPLAAALRAAREQAESTSVDDSEEALEPYPLILVRPGGQAALHDVKSVIEAIGMDYGVEHVGSDWNLKFLPPNPELALVEQQSIDLARKRLETLISAAPGMFPDRRSRRSGDEYEYEYEIDRYEVDDPVETSGSKGNKFAFDTTGRDGEQDSGQYAQQLGSPGNRADGSQNVASSGDPQASGGSGGEEGATRSRATSEAEGLVGAPPAGGSLPAENGMSGLASSTDVDPARAVDTHAGSGQIRRPPPAEGRPTANINARKPRGRSWRTRNRNAIPVRRPVNVVVRRDRLAILRGNELDAATIAAGREIRLTGSTSEAIEGFLEELDAHVEDWGIAGQGLQWRPVLKLNVGPDGQVRARELAKLLRRRGIELKTTSVAEKHKEEAGRETL